MNSAKKSGSESVSCRAARRMSKTRLVWGGSNAHGLRSNSSVHGAMTDQPLAQLISHQGSANTETFPFLILHTVSQQPPSHLTPIQGSIVSCCRCFKPLATAQPPSNTLLTFHASIFPPWLLIHRLSQHHALIRTKSEVVSWVATVCSRIRDNCATQPRPQPLA